MSINIQTQKTVLDLLVPVQNRTLLKSFSIALAATLFIAILAQVQIPLYPVPLTLQPFAVVLVGLVLPWRLASSAVLMYIAMASMGLPILTGFKAGLIWPSSGYILGYVPAVILISLLTQKWAGLSILKRALVVALGNVVLFSCGVSVLSLFVGIDTAIQTGFMPFVFGDFVVKNILAVLISVQTYKLISRKKS
ncbi:MAG: biotin transporter BioY [Alphaproteobacteria bacterium]|nr:biotin transporter BioY [Alphaproteobacteria bacterium]